MDIVSPVEILQKLIRFNTTNPPGNEIECIQYINTLFKSVGLEAKIVGERENRKNLFVRLKGEGSSPPLLMYGHVDVVTTENQEWSVPPFEGVVKDHFLYGRGALDMKGPLTMMIWAIMRAKAERIKPKGDILFTAVCDEEEEGDLGASYLVDNYKELFQDVRYAIGEIGGFTMYIDNKRFYPIMVSEKQKCSIRAVIRGKGGHGSIPVHDEAMAKLGRTLMQLNNKSLPVHITPPVRQMLEALIKYLPFQTKIVLGRLLNPLFTDKILNCLGEKKAFFDPILHNTVNATIVGGGNKINVIPSEVWVEFDGRLLPGLKSDGIISELRSIIKEDIEFEVMRYVPGTGKVDMGLFDSLAHIIREFDSEGIPIPFVVSGVTDARYFGKLGIQTYGFTPMLLQRDIDFSKLIHGQDERIPLEALEVGSKAVFELIKSYK